MTLHPKYITDENGKKVSVILSINEYNQLLTELDELEDLKLFDAAKESDSICISRHCGLETEILSASIAFPIF